MKAFLDNVRMLVKETKLRGELKELMTTAEALVRLRLEMGLKPGEAVIVDGVHITVMPLRDERIGQAVRYAAARWHIGMTLDDARNLYKAVPDKELKELIPIIMEQHFDDIGFPDPTEEMSEKDLEEVREAMEDIGIVDPNV
jgi:hypothetical protein